MANYPYTPLDWQASPHDFGGDNMLAQYQEETTQRFIPGTRFTTWDGRVYKYSKAVGNCRSSYVVMNDSGVVNISGSATSVAVGDRALSITLGSDDGYGGGGVAENELIGGYVVTGHGVSLEQTRLIIDNNAAVVTTGVLTITVDGPFADALTTPFTEIMLNPYNYIKGFQGGANQWAAGMGVPACTTTSGNYFWIQTWGPCYCTGTGSTSNAYDQRSIYMYTDGSIRDGSEITIETGYQHIGFSIDESTSATAIPFVMLQISI